MFEPLTRRMARVACAARPADTMVLTVFEQNADNDEVWLSVSARNTRRGSDYQTTRVDMTCEDARALFAWLGARLHGA